MKFSFFMFTAVAWYCYMSSDLNLVQDFKWPYSLTILTWLQLLPCCFDSSLVQVARNTFVTCHCLKLISEHWSDTSSSGHRAWQHLPDCIYSSCALIQVARASIYPSVDSSLCSLLYLRSTMHLQASSASLHMIQISFWLTIGISISMPVQCLICQSCLWALSSDLNLVQVESRTAWQYLPDCSCSHFLSTQV